MRIFKKIIWFCLFVFSILILWINIKIHSDSFNKEERKKDILLQLNYLKAQLKFHQLGDRMQNIFPEGFVFSNALYGLSWCELGISDTSKTIRQSALTEALFAYDQINSPKAKSIFDSSLKPKYGIFYLGWKNYLLSKILLMDSTFQGSQYYKTVYINNCEEISQAVQKSKVPYLPSYQNQVWPADIFVAMASLSNYEKLCDKKYKTIIASWIHQVKSNLDPITKMIPHKVNPENAAPAEGARGCSISLILRLLAEIDYDFSKQQYQQYKKYFVSKTFGLPSINEYPQGQSGSGDIDSGPVIFGVGFSGTIVSIGTFSVMGDFDLADQQYKTINAFGFSFTTSDTKTFLFGQLPIADAFIVWGRTSQLNQSPNNARPSGFWPMKFHLISVLLISFVWILFYRKRIFNKIKWKISQRRK